MEFIGRGDDDDYIKYKFLILGLSKKGKANIFSRVNFRDDYLDFMNFQKDLSPTIRKIL